MRGLSCDSVNPGHDPRRGSHIGAVVFAEALDHEVFLAADAAKEQRTKTHKARRPGDPIRQQQTLRNRPQPERGIHRVADVAIHALSDELVPLAHAQTDRPVAAEIAMGGVEEPQRRREDETPEPTLSRREGVISEPRKSADDVGEWHEEETGRRNHEQDVFYKPAAIARDLIAPRAARMRIANEIPGDERDAPDHLG